MPTLLGQNQYGKAENRVVRVVRDGDTHHIRDLSVSVALSGDLDAVHHSGDNAHVLPTDTTKNTVFAFARKYGIDSPEQFGLLLARHFADTQDAIHRARVRVEEYAWDRIPGAHGHSFVRRGRETRTAQIRYDGEHCEVVGGLKDLTVLNTTDSEFWGYAKDEYTTLQETHDRILATDVTACWRYAWTGEGGDGDGGVRAPDWNRSYERARDRILAAFAETYSYSLQQTLYQMGTRVIEGSEEDVRAGAPDAGEGLGAAAGDAGEDRGAAAGDGAGGVGGDAAGRGAVAVDEIRFSLPNNHHFPVDLRPFGLDNETPDGAVYFAADRPYGLIEATVLRDGAEARIPADMTAPA
ncbi:factor-independent urate hydroxylase [Streptomyces sp. Ru87]|uniref:factor-independent urate hydroxylase n=1 Tax=Streptomyces sp. Ru87 TaxID=2044307 RepID=UPI000BF82AB2|nr:urate oxidase [Streptomyces sp. Ru87]